MIDLVELERRLNEALSKETDESLNKWINSQRNDKRTGQGCANEDEVMGKVVFSPHEDGA